MLRKERDYAGQRPRTLEELEKYAEDTAGSLLYLTLESLGLKSIETDHIASHIGRAYGLALSLRSLAYHAAQRKTYLPLDLCVKHGLADEALYALVKAQSGEIVSDYDLNRTASALSDVVYEVASVAKIHLDHARMLTNDKVPRIAYAAFRQSVTRLPVRVRSRAC
jgi:NADH dehydrogenase [ubiquinone] 1 alpha subcomplex assembly factor 6